MPPPTLRSVVGAAVLFGLVASLGISGGCRRHAAEGISAGARVVDEAGILSPAQRRSIADYLEWVASEQGVDYRVVVMDGAPADLLRQAVATYARSEIGEETDGRGLLLLVDVDAKRARVEVGYALEHRVRDAEASSMIGQFLAPYFAVDDAAAGIEASVERLVDLLEPGREEAAESWSIAGSGGAGATAALLAGIDRLTPESEARLKEILVPQARPEDCVQLEMALMHRGIYYRDAPMYDEAWRRAVRPELPSRRLKEIAREWDGPFSVALAGDHAIAYFTGEKGRRWGPTFLRRTADGWIVDASLVASYIVYDYSNNYWYAVEGDYPYLAIVRSVYPMKRVSLETRGAAWMIDAAAAGGS